MDLGRSFDSLPDGPTAGQQVRGAHHAKVASLRVNGISEPRAWLRYVPDRRHRDVREMAEHLQVSDRAQLPAVRDTFERVSTSVYEVEG